MINRSKIKYAIKKLFPKIIFNIILTLWQTIFIKFVTILDTFRLKKFTTYQAIKTSHHKHHFSIFISPKNGFIDNYIYLYKIYEPHVLDIIEDNLQKGGTFVDIGANIGQHSMFAASIVGDTGKVFSFEPIPYIYNQLLDSVHINHFEKIVTVHNIALGTENKNDTLYIETNNVGGSSIVAPHGTKTEAIQINIRKGDDILEQISNIHLIKIDVEGYEYEVLSGIEKTLRIHRPTIILEFSGELYISKKNNDGEKIISLLENIGYDIYDIEDYMKKITSKEHFLFQFTQGKLQCDILCVPKK